MIEVRRVDYIKVGERMRKELGDIDALAASIEANGALPQPIVIRPDGTLIAGARRLAACKRLGRSQIEVYVRSDLRSALDLRIAERDENTCRKDMTPSEKVALARRLEELERPKAAERKASSQAKPGERIGSGKSPEPMAGSRHRRETREIVGQAVGMSGQTYQRAKGGRGEGRGWRSCRSGRPTGDGRDRQSETRLRTRHWQEHQRPCMPGHTQRDP